MSARVSKTNAIKRGANDRSPLQSNETDSKKYKSNAATFLEEWDETDGSLSNVSKGALKEKLRLCVEILKDQMLVNSVLNEELRSAKVAFADKYLNHFLHTTKTTADAPRTPNLTNVRRRSSVKQLSLPKGPLLPDSASNSTHRDSTAAREIMTVTIKARPPNPKAIKLMPVEGTTNEIANNAALIQNIEKGLNEKGADIKMTRIKALDNGQVLIVLDESENVETCTEVLNSISTSTNMMVSKSSRRRNPRMKILRVAKDQIPEDVCGSLQRQNTSIFKTPSSDPESFIKVITKLTSTDSQTASIIIECDPASARRAISAKKVKLGLCVYEIVEHYHIRICKKCHKLGHNQSECKDTHRCGNCGGEHKSEECNSLSYQCTRCQISKIYKKEASNHPASEVAKCPSFLHAKAMLRFSIAHDE